MKGQKVRLVLWEDKKVGAPVILWRVSMSVPSERRGGVSRSGLVQNSHRVERRPGMCRVSSFLYTSPRTHFLSAAVKLGDHC